MTTKRTDIHRPGAIAPHIGHQHMCFAGGGVGAVAYVSPDQDPEQYRRQFDCAATIELLKRAITAIEGGDGVEATKAAGAAWFRISQAHKT